MTMTTEADKDFLRQLQEQADKEQEGVMFYVISSVKDEDGVPDWSRSIPVKAADARALAKHLVIATGRIVEVVRVCETFKPTITYGPACGGCKHMEFESCPFDQEFRNKGLGCSDFVRFK